MNGNDMLMKVEYSRKEIRELLLMIDVGNRPRWSQKGPIGLKRTVSAFGIVGMHCLVYTLVCLLYLISLYWWSFWICIEFYEVECCYYISVLLHDELQSAGCKVITHTRFVNYGGNVLCPVAPTTIKLEPSSNLTLTLVQTLFSLHQRSSALNGR